MYNLDLRREITMANVKYWQVAEALNITDGNFSRKLRRELPETEKQKIRDIIADLKAKAAI